MSQDSKENSFEDLVQSYHKLVLHLIHSYYGGAFQGQAEDLSQEIWTKLWNQFKKNESQVVNFKSYLYRTVQTTLWDAVRKRDRDPVELAQPELDQDLSSKSHEARFLAEYRVERLLNRLKREERLMMKAHLQGFSYPEIATMLNTSEGRVRNLISRIKKKLAGMTNAP